MSEPLTPEREREIRQLVTREPEVLIPEDAAVLLAEIDRLRALVQKYETRLEINHCFELRPDRQFSGDVDHDLIRRDLSETEKERFPDAVECRDATIALLESNLAERDKMLDVAAKGMEALRAALSDRDRQLAELRVQLEQARTYCCYRCLSETKNADGVCDHCQAEAEGKELPYNQ